MRYKFKGTTYYGLSGVQLSMYAPRVTKLDAING